MDLSQPILLIFYYFKEARLFISIRNILYCNGNKYNVIYREFIIGNR